MLESSEFDVKNRFNALVNSEKSGHHTDIVYLLGGQRPLCLTYEPIAKELTIEKLTKQQNISIETAKTKVAATLANFFENNIDADRSKIAEYFTSQNITWAKEADMLEKISAYIKGKTLELSDTQFISVDTPKKYINGVWHRPTTESTLAN